MKYIVTLNGKQFEVEVERGQATAVYTGEATAPAPAPTASVVPATTATPASTSAAAPAGTGDKGGFPFQIKHFLNPS